MVPNIVQIESKLFPIQHSGEAENRLRRARWAPLGAVPDGSAVGAQVGPVKRDVLDFGEGHWTASSSFFGASSAPI